MLQSGITSEGTAMASWITAEGERESEMGGEGRRDLSKHTEGVVWLKEQNFAPPGGQRVSLQLFPSVSIPACLRIKKKEGMFGMFWK